MENNDQKPSKVFTFELNKPTRCGHVYTRELFENYHKERMAVCVSSMEPFPSRCSSKQLMNPWSCGYGIITELTDNHLKLEFHETAATSFDVDVTVVPLILTMAFLPRVCESVTRELTPFLVSVNPSIFVKLLVPPSIFIKEAPVIVDSRTIVPDNISQ